MEPSQLHYPGSSRCRRITVAGDVDDDIDTIDKDYIKSGGLDVKQEGNGIKRRRIVKKTPGPAKLAEEEARVRLRGKRDNPTAYSQIIHGVDITEKGEDIS